MQKRPETGTPYAQPADRLIIRQQLAEQIRDARKAAALTQQQLSAQLGVARSQIPDGENANRPSTPKTSSASPTSAAEVDAFKPHEFMTAIIKTTNAYYSQGKGKRERFHYFLKVEPQLSRRPMITPNRPSADTSATRLANMRAGHADQIHAERVHF